MKLYEFKKKRKAKTGTATTKEHRNSKNKTPADKAFWYTVWHIVGAHKMPFCLLIWFFVWPGS